MQMQDQVEGQLFLSFAVGQCAATLKLLSEENKHCWSQGILWREKSVDGPPISIVSWLTPPVVRGNALCQEAIPMDASAPSRWVRNGRKKMCCDNDFLFALKSIKIKWPIAMHLQHT